MPDGYSGCTQNMAPKKLSPGAVRAFRKTVYAYFRTQGRALPWRIRPTPYRVLVSEIMLQQTQVDRAVPIFTAFVKKFPTVRALAVAPRRSVLTAWRGLGYNRRAVYLQRTAAAICEKYGGRVPADPDVLQTFPGIGAATAASIVAFAYNRPTVFIETNIRSVFIHHFFADSRAPVSDAAIVPLVAQTLDRAHPARWYNALMDYGVFLKKTHANPSRKSAQHVRQKPFAGSDRQLRGKILSKIVERGKVSTASLCAGASMREAERILRLADALAAEGLISKRNGHYRA